MTAPHKNGSPVAPSAESAEDFAAAVVKFALRGHCLKRVCADGGLVEFFVMSRWGQSRSFTNWHSTQAFLTQIGGVV